MPDHYSIVLKFPIDPIPIDHIKPGICLTFEFFYQNEMVKKEEITWNGELVILLKNKGNPVVIDSVFVKFQEKEIWRSRVKTLNFTSDTEIHFKIKGITGSSIMDLYKGQKKPRDDRYSIILTDNLAAMQKFLKETEYIEETAQDRDPCGWYFEQDCSNGSCPSQIKGHFDYDYLQGWKSNSGKAYYDEENTIFPEPEESVEKSVTKEKELTIIALPRKILWQ